MALVVESTSTVTANDADNLTITKPTGVAVGDLLIICSSGSAQPAHVTCTGFSTLLAKVQDNPGAIPDVYINALYKIADSGDVSAANYTIALAGTNTLGCAAMFRISGWTSGSPLYGSATTGGNQDATTFTAQATGLSIARPTQQILIQVIGFFSTSSPYSSATMSNYSITSSDSNPTWTEVVDAQFLVTGSTNRGNLAVAYASSTATSTITAYSADGATDTNGTEDGYASMLLVLCSPNSPTAQSTLLDATPTILTGQTGSNSSRADTSLGVFPPTINTANGSMVNPIWTNPDKGTTTWTNPNK